MQNADRSVLETEVSGLIGLAPLVPLPPDISAEDATYYHAQAEVIHRIYRLLYPTASLRYFLKALDSFSGSPNLVTIKSLDSAAPVAGSDDSAAWPDVTAQLDASLVGTYQFDNPEGATTRITVVAGIPLPPKANVSNGIRTSPVINQRAARAVLRVSPVLFEQAKYFMEQRMLRQRSTLHRFAPLPREGRQARGSVPDTRDTSQRPSIVIGFHWLELGGAERLAFDTVIWARAAGFRVLVVAERSDAQNLASRLPADPDIEFIRVDAYLPLRLWGEFIDTLVRRENVRAIHIHHNTRLYDNLQKLKEKYPDLTVIDSTHIIEYSNGGFPRTSGVWTNYIDYHHVISRELVSFYLDHFGVSEKVKLGRMFDAVEFPDDLPEPVFNLNSGQKSCRLVFVGRIVHQKRAPLVVAILRRLRGWARRHGVALHLDMVGTGAYLDIVRRMITRSGLDAMVTLHPPDTDVQAILRQADILLLPSSNEGLALVCYEAIRNGAIPISTDVGSQSELIPEALIVPISPLACVRASAALVTRLMTDPVLLQSCTADLVRRYRGLRHDPTAQEVLTALYRQIMQEVPGS